LEYEVSLGLGGAPQRDLLRFTDPISQHTLALRSDITGQVGRIAGTRLAGQARPLRLCYAGPVLRVKGDQLSPARERMQAGAELIGDDGEAAAAEVLDTAVAALKATGIKGLSLDLTMPSLVAELAAAGWTLGRASLGQVQALLDGKDAGALAALGAGAFVPLIAAAGPAPAALAALGGLALPAAVQARLALLARLVAGLGAAHPDVGVTLDPTERHGFEYQTWLGFSLFGAGIAGEVGRGGAYRLDTPAGAEAAIGFSLYVDGLVDAGLGLGSARRILLPAGTAPMVAAGLRTQGWQTVALLAGDGRAQDYRCGWRWDGTQPVPA
ncbi:MAG: ATP phosphoribosyltransferase regulatory subunit, partial [Sphingomonadales bacterium]